MFNIPAISLALLIAATWRLASLLANEEGPHMIFHKLRKLFQRLDRKWRWFRHSRLSHGIECEYCNSIWIGTLFTIAYGLIYPGSISGLGWFVLPLSLSAGSILFKHVTNLLRSADIRLDQQNQAAQKVSGFDLGKPDLVTKSNGHTNERSV